MHAEDGGGRLQHPEIEDGGNLIVVEGPEQSDEIAPEAQGKLGLVIPQRTVFEEASEPEADACEKRDDENEAGRARLRNRVTQRQECTSKSAVASYEYPRDGYERLILQPSQMPREDRSLSSSLFPRQDFLEKCECPRISRLAKPEERGLSYFGIAIRAGNLNQSRHSISLRALRESEYGLLTDLAVESSLTCEVSEVLRDCFAGDLPEPEDRLSANAVGTRVVASKSHQTRPYLDTVREGHREYRFASDLRRR